MTHPILFLGAGASLASGMPKTTEMTAEILSGACFAYRTWGRYELGAPDPGPGGNERVEAIVRFLPTIQSLIDLPADATYADLQYILIQLEDDHAGEYENPALRPFWTELRANVATAVLTTATWGVEDLVAEARRYVEDAVAALINEYNARLPVAPLAVEAARAVVGDGTTDIVTLNHDTIVERALDVAGIPFTDGFERSVKGDWFWYPPALDRAGVRVLKLHGSVNWRREIQGEQRLLRIGRAEAWTMDETRLDPHAELLAGTHNKILHYSRGHFGDLHCAFRRSLTCADRLVVAGYGFRDKAVNGMLIEWMRERAHHITIVHPDPDGLYGAARPAVQRAWRTWDVTRRLLTIKKKAEDATWSECRT